MEPKDIVALQAFMFGEESSAEEREAALFAVVMLRQGGESDRETIRRLLRVEQVMLSWLRPPEALENEIVAFFTGGQLDRLADEEREWWLFAAPRELQGVLMAKAVAEFFNVPASERLAFWRAADEPGVDAHDRVVARLERTVTEWAVRWALRAGEQVVEDERGRDWWRREGDAEDHLGRLWPEHLDPTLYDMPLPPEFEQELRTRVQQQAALHAARTDAHTYQPEYGRRGILGEPDRPLLPIEEYAQAWVAEYGEGLELEDLKRQSRGPAASRERDRRRLRALLVVALHDEHDFSQEAIADLFGCDQSAVSRLLARAAE